MRLALIALLALGPAAFAQRGNLNPIGNNGNILNPGIPLRGPSPVVRGPVVSGPGLAATTIPLTLPSSVSGLNRGFRPGRTGGRRGFAGGGVIIPYAVPAFDGFYGGYGYPSVHNPAPGQYDPIFGGYNPGPAGGGWVTPSDQGYAPAPAAPTVVINQNFQADTVHPQLRDYSNVQLPEPGTVATPPAAAADDQPTVYLIAMRDHTIVPAIAYWVAGDTLNYVTLNGKQNQVSLALVDRDFSLQLNAERQVPFRLPAPR
jgi:hypothetical protein